MLDADMGRLYHMNTVAQSEQISANNEWTLAAQVLSDERANSLARMDTTTTEDRTHGSTGDLDASRLGPGARDDPVGSRVVAGADCGVLQGPPILQHAADSTPAITAPSAKCGQKGKPEGNVLGGPLSPFSPVGFAPPGAGGGFASSAPSPFRNACAPNCSSACNAFPKGSPKGSKDGVPPRLDGVVLGGARCPRRCGGLALPLPPGGPRGRSPMHCPRRLRGWMSIT